MGLINFLKNAVSGDNKEKKAPGKAKKKSASKNVKKKSSKKAKKKTSLKKPASGKKTAKKPVKKVIPTQTKEKLIGIVTHYFGKIKVGIIKLKAELKVGDKIHIKGAHDDFKLNVKSMQFNHKSILKGQKGKEVGIKVSQRVHENDKIYLVAK